MRNAKYLALLSTLALLFPLCASAREKNERSVSIAEAVHIGATQLPAGRYKVQWQEEAGPAVNVEFLRDGKVVATVPGTLKTNDHQVTEDDVVIQTVSTNKKVLSEIDFAHQKEALVFAQQQG
ncbi:MAG TPA: hypothetical protein VLW84_04980 [Terriglobales bacterium]|nr:hypothetical protein [Terriglobales bacterium]